MTRSHMTLLAATLLAGCSSSGSSPMLISGSAKPGDVTVELSGVTLADECGDAGQAPPPPTTTLATVPAPRAEAKPSADSDSDAKSAISAGSCATPGGCRGPTRAPCQQTSMQIALRSPAGATPATLRVKQVELVDASGKVVDVLIARTPSRWDTDHYVAWDETVAAGQTLATSYLLSSPNWGTLTNGKWSAHTKLFDLRVTFVVGTKEHRIEKQRVQPAMIEPEVDT